MLNTKLNQSNIEIMVKTIAANTEVANKIVEKLLNGDAYSFETEFGESGVLIDDFLKNRLIDIITLASILTFDDDYHTLFEI